MLYDKYRDWPLRFHSGGVFGLRVAPIAPLGRKPSIEEQVLSDLAEAKDEVDKIEILDSFAAYAKRDYAGEVSILVGELIASNLSQIASVCGQTMVSQYLPSTKPTHRARPSRQD